MKSLLLEAVRAPKTVVNESSRDTYAQPHVEKPKILSSEEIPNLRGFTDLGVRYPNHFDMQNIL